MGQFYNSIAIHYFPLLETIGIVASSFLLLPSSRLTSIRYIRYIPYIASKAELPSAIK
jgi:hypothetical protein